MIKFCYSSLVARCIIFFLTGSIDAQSTLSLRFTTINHSDGLTNNTINAIVHDDLGFIWIGTNNGLCRYEASSNVKVYQSGNPKVDGGLQSSNIRALFLDSKSNLWIGTRLGGLTRYHQPSGTWTTFRHDKDDPKSLSNDEVLTIMEDSKGRIWVGTEDGLNVYLRESDSFISFIASNEIPGTLKGKAVLSVMEDNRGWIWVGTWAGGLHLMQLPSNGNIEEASFRSFIPNEKNESAHIWKIFQDNQNRYWVGSRGAGLFLMELPFDSNVPPNDLDWAPTFHNYIKDGSSVGLLNDNISEIFQDSNDNLWIGTVNGLNCILANEINTPYIPKAHPEKPEFNFCQHIYEINNSTSLTNNAVSTIFEDAQGLIWFGTFSGISQYNASVNQFNIYQLEDKYTMAPNTQNLYIDTEGIAWLGNGENGILKFDFEKSEIIDFSINQKEFAGNFVTSLHSMDDENLYIGMRDGICKLEMKTNKIKHFPLPQWMKLQMGSFDIRSIFKDRKNKIWIGSTQGLYIIDENSGDYTRCSSEPNNPKTISDNSINQIFEDSYGSIWIATYNGLNRVTNSSAEKVEFERFKHDADCPDTSIPSNRIVCMEEINGVIFIGSSSGLFGYDLKKKTFTNFNKENNKYSIQSFEKTKDGHIWASTTEGIFYFNVESKKFNKYDKEDGLGDIVFQQGASHVDRNGWLYFGSRRGITRFDPLSIDKNLTPPPVYVTDIRKMGPNGLKETNGTYIEEIILEHDEYYVSIDYAALNYNRSEKNQYAFKLEGLEENWNYIDKKTPAIYTNLKHGEYVFRLKAANNDGVWNEKGLEIKVFKKPAFWETLWFKIGGLIFTISCIHLAVKLYTRRIKESNRALNKYNIDLNKEIDQRKIVEAALQEREQHMESLVNQRTNELEVKNKEVKSLLEKLKVRNERLEIDIAKRTNKLRASNEELQRSNKDLEQFAYIASHDLQEPLRVVGNFVGLLKRRYKDIFDEEAFQYIDFAVDGVSRMSEQIKSILTFSRVSQNNIKLQRTNMDTIIAIKLHDLSQNIVEKNVQCDIESLPEIICDKNLIKMVFHNLISNAIKFNKSEIPRVSISCKKSSDQFWEFCVRDNGIGIPEEFQEKIFEIFRRLHSKQDYDGTGIGLALCQKIVHRHGGNIWVESKQGEGTSFYFTISKYPVEIDGSKGVKQESLTQEMYN